MMNDERRNNFSPINVLDYNGLRVVWSAVEGQD